MITVINKYQVQVIPVASQRMVFVNGEKTPYFMKWNSKLYRWEFADEALHDEIKDIEHHLSNYIIKLEKR